MTLPVVVSGMEATNSTSRGYSCAESRSRTHDFISLANASLPANPILQHDIRLDDFGANRVRLADSRCQRDGWMSGQAILDLSGTDTEARGRYDVVIAAEELDIAILILDALVASGHPVANKLLLGGFGVLPVFEEHDRIGPCDGDLAGFALFHTPSLVIDHGDGVTRNRQADRSAAADPDSSARRQDQIAFGLAVELVFTVIPSSSRAHS